MPHHRQRIFRLAVAAIVRDRRGRILICERSDTAGAWQFPQGGIDDGETARAALRREVREEIGLRPGDYRITQVEGPFRYRLPAGLIKYGFRGQSHHYFLLSLKRKHTPINFNDSKPEFRSARWIDPVEFRLEWLPPNKRGAYQRVFRAMFGLRLK